MSKNKGLKKHKHEEEMEDDFDFFYDDAEALDDESIADMMHGLVNASNHQQIIALELTKLIVEKAAASRDEEAVFSTFQRAMKVVAESAPLKGMWENQ